MYKTLLKRRLVRGYVSEAKSGLMNETREGRDAQGRSSL